MLTKTNRPQTCFNLFSKEYYHQYKMTDAKLKDSI